MGISHHVSCSHAHQQNGSAERKHRHIVEVGLTLLAHSSMPLKFWDEAFLTAVFLINRLPSRVINQEIPFYRLYGTQPDYLFLRTFGCACWPHLRPYNSRKLEFRSQKCVFLGYSNHPPVASTFLEMSFFMNMNFLLPPCTLTLAPNSELRLLFYLIS